MKAAKTIRKVYKKLVASILLIAMLLTSIEGFGNILKNESVEGFQGDMVFPVYLFDYTQNEINNGKLVKFGGSQYDYEWNRCDGHLSLQGGKPGYAVPGIVEEKLVNGLPVFKESCSDLFSLNPASGKTVVYSSSSNTKQVGLQFYKENGYYVVNSGQYGYTYNQNTGIIERGYGNGGFWPFGTGNGDNQYYFGMNFNVNFNVSENGKSSDGSDTVFEFSGDDDFWVFIDQKLVLDLGGIHKTVYGKLDFYHDSSYISNVTDFEYGGAPQTQTLSALMGYENKAEMLKDLSSGEHTLSVFYLERGSYASNCMIKFNFTNVSSTIPTDVNFTKVDYNDASLEGAEFGLYSAVGGEEPDYSKEPEYRATSTGEEENNVCFKNVVAGQYYLKEISAPAGYDKDNKSYLVTVTNGTSKVEDGKYVTTEGSFSIKDGDEEIVKLINYPESEVVVNADKTAVINDWNDREYKITLSGEAYVQSVEDEIVSENRKNPINLVLTFDMSRSMLFPAELTNGMECKKSKLNSNNVYYYIDDTSNATVYTVKYRNNKWQKRDASSSDNNAWSDLDNSKRVYFTASSNKTRLEVLKNAACTMVDELPEGSTVSIVTFANNEDVNKIVTKNVAVTETNRDEIKKKINDLKVSGSGGTDQLVGLKLAQKVLEEEIKNQNSSYVVFLSDGCLNSGDSGTGLDDIYKTANAIKESKATIFSIGLALKLGGKTADAEAMLKNIASPKKENASEKYYFDASSEDTLTDVMKEIVTTAVELSKPVYVTVYPKYDVVDVIDARFELAEGEAERLVEETQAVISKDIQNGTTKIEWFDVEQSHEISFLVVAKEEYLGGNAVETNLEYKISTEYNGKSYEKTVESPKVNVKIDLVANDYEDVVFLGESLKEYFTSEKHDGMMGCPSGVDSDWMTKDVKYATYQWYEYNPGKGEWEKIDDTGIADKVATSLSTMTFKCVTTVIPKVEDTEQDAVDTAKSQKEGTSFEDMFAKEDGQCEATGTYIVKVVAGEITISKEIDREYLDNVPYTSEEKEAIEAYQTVVFTVKRFAKGTTDFSGKPLEEYEVAINPSADKNYVTLTNLWIGEYVIEEQTDWSFKYNQEEEFAKKNLITIGKRDDNGMPVNYDVEVSFKNFLKNKIIFSDSCNVKNVFKEKWWKNEENN